MPVTYATVGRLPIVDGENSITAYRIVSMPVPGRDTAPVGVPKSPDSDVISDVLGIGFDKVSAGRPVVITLSEQLMAHHALLPLPPEQTILHSTAASINKSLQRYRQLKNEGYRFAIRWDNDFAADHAELADYVTVNAASVPITELAALIKRAKSVGKPLLVEQINTAEGQIASKIEGADLLSGTAVVPAVTLRSKALSPAAPNVIRLSNMVLDLNVDYARIEDLLRAEPILSYQVLQLAAIGRLGEVGRKVDSIRRALILLGLDRLRGWIPALLFKPDHRSVDTQLPAVLTRARLAELIVARTEPKKAGHAFAAGMLSALNLIVGVDRYRLQEMLEIPRPLRMAAFTPLTDTGRVVYAITDFEQTGRQPSDILDMDQSVFTALAAEAFAWAISTAASIDELAENN